MLCPWCSWIRASWYNYENTQQGALYRLMYYSKSALHVSGDVFAHHQEHLTVFTVSGSVHPSYCRLVSWMCWKFIIPSQLYVFRAMFSPIIRSTWLYLQYLLVFTQVAAGWCLGWVETELSWLWGVYTPHNQHSSVSTHLRHQPAATWVNTTICCKYSLVLMMMGENIARNK